jgi:hypothetical protein
MAQSTIQVNSGASFDSGAFNVDANLATACGYGLLAGGGTLATAVGVAVVPVPTIGLALAGSGLVVAGNFHAIKDYFSSDKQSDDTAVTSAAA